MIRPNRFLATATVVALIVAIALSFFYQYRAFNGLQQARLQTDLVISRYLPETVFALIKRKSSDSMPSVLDDQQLELRVNGLNIIALELLSLRQTPLLIYGERPVGDLFKDTTGFESAKQGIPASSLVSPAWFNAEDNDAERRHIQISQMAIIIPDGQNIGAVAAIYSDLSTQVKEIYLTQLMLLGLAFTGLSCLNFYLYRSLKKGKKIVEHQLVQNSKGRLNASHDALTGLPNRAMLSQRLKHAVDHSHRHQHSLILMFLDLDGFKAVNDTLGHHIGDQLLKTVARRLNECVREGDTVARLGGDEFVVLLPMFDSRYTEQASEAAQRVLDSLSSPMAIQGREIPLGCSIGVSRYPDDGKDADTLLKNADSAMYQAKDRGRNNVQFYSLKPAGSMSAPSNLKSDLKKALHRQEFYLFYQPQLELESGSIAGFSVLLHWLHPVFGMGLADKRLLVDKKNNPAFPVGLWMLENACFQRMHWQKKGFHCGPLTVYLSAKLFQFETLDKTVRGILDKAQLKPEYLELELTGLLLNENMENAFSVVSRLKSLGVRLSVDATEFSPNILRQLPLDSLRIGHGSISKLMLNDGADSIVTRAMIDLGDQLSLSVIAEGVETPKQRQYLRAKGCSQVQGPCTGSPLSSHEADKLLQSHQKQSSTEGVQ